MARSSSRLKTLQPKNVFAKPLTVDFKSLFKALAKGIGHTAVGKWEDLGSDTVEALSSLDLTTTPGELAFLLIRRAVTRALFSLVAESASQQLADAKADADALVEKLDYSIVSRDVELDRTFLDRPGDLPLVHDLQFILQKWLEQFAIPSPTAQAIVERLPSYFVHALNQEWRRGAKTYAPLIDALATPFAKAGDREWAWSEYAALLQRRVEEGVFDEPFGLKQIFVSPNCYYTEESKRQHVAEHIAPSHKPRTRVVVPLAAELEAWLARPKPQDAIRVISGGPGSGKSSFARMFSASIAQQGKCRVLFLPLHLIDPTKDLVDEVGRFVRDEGVLSDNPLNPESPERDLLLIFDGLDELATQGKAAAETARAFVREVERTVEKRNIQSTHLRIILSGRELVVQENETEFRRPRQILTLLPYYVPSRENVHGDGEYRDDYQDPHKLLAIDLRQEWWKQYGDVTGKAYQGLPTELGRRDLEEVTAQPLLNYLIALSFVRERVDFTKEVNLNTIYADLVAAVHERGYEKHRPYAPIRHMSPADFVRVLEEVGLAAWHGDGRTTTIREIEAHCRDSGVGMLLDAFKEGAKSGVTRLLAAFFFRQYGSRASGEPTFVFTHKSFGEYLTARRIVRAVERIVKERERRAGSPDEGWDEREALRHWTLVCGASTITPYLNKFVSDEIKLKDVVEVGRWQTILTALFTHMLNHGMPTEQLQGRSFREFLFQSRNAEEALLAALNACARMTNNVSRIEHADPTAFGTWLKRIQGQRKSGDSALALSCLSFLDLHGCIFHMADLYGADLQFSDLRKIQAYSASMEHANFTSANLSGAHLRGANLQRANFTGADLRGASLDEQLLTDADFRGATVDQATLALSDTPLFRGRKKSRIHTYLVARGAIVEGRPKRVSRKRANVAKSV